MAKVAELTGDVAQLFEIVTPDLPIVGNYGVHFGAIDFANLSVEEADLLIAQGFPHLRRRELRVAAKPRTPIPAAVLVESPPQTAMEALEAMTMVKPNNS